ncbi:hypothetical protein [Falsibacillus albus]|uniref:DUF2157 domain-containing protein n=1 Tax=Falsibacillus albus TaxID=2478915 RepID=A0A3L7K7H9_9BACI|nr:hypothetical protein [Falsibacillus albus]RLQ98194.1 hypothetical protein D9X91_02060 [Falsibacillus albus]
MDSNLKRKETIVNEILLWKKNRMLPDHYCDFLLALYTEGNAPSTIHDHKNIKQSQSAPMASFLKIAAISLMLIISVFVIYFTELSVLLQTTILTFFVVFILIAIFYYSNKPSFQHLLYIAFAMLLLLLTVNLCGRLFHNNIWVLYITLFFNCILWIFSSFKFALLYFRIAGFLGVMILFISIFI